jgi:hypothetical protein
MVHHHLIADRQKTVEHRGSGAFVLARLTLCWVAVVAQGTWSRAAVLLRLAGSGAGARPQDSLTRHVQGREPGLVDVPVISTDP